jgi:putative methyltransferase (TIGR04325 family)
MKKQITRIIKSITPPIALEVYRRLSGQVCFSGNYRTWSEALGDSSGYDSDIILHKVRESLLKVKRGEALFEQDSVLFDKIYYSWPLLAGFLWIASRNGNRLNIVDFGGSLGTTYYQNIRFLSHLDDLRWSIVEQEKFVECGKRDFENEHLRFFHDLNECIEERHPDTVLFSGILQYLEKPYDFLKDVLERDFAYIIIDRTPFLEEGDDRLTVQKVPPEQYPASYPAWFFNLGKLRGFFAKDYELMAEFDLAESFHLAGAPTLGKGFIFVRKDRSMGAGKY